MSKRDDGGPAFPLSVAVGPNGDGYSSADISGTSAGMSLRDWFAGQALAGLMANKFGPDTPFKTWGMEAYDMADAMLAERSK